MRRAAILATVAALAIAVCANAATRERPAKSASDMQIARRFVPADVKKDVADAHTDIRVSIAVARADLDRTGHKDYLIAAYGGVFSGALLVLKTKPEPKVVAEGNDVMMWGHAVELTLIDVDSDQVPEIVVSLLDGQWGARIFQWQKGRLVPLLGRDDPVIDPLFIDLDGDGVLEMVGSASRLGYTSADTMIFNTPVFKLEQGHYHLSDNLVEFDLIDRYSSFSECTFGVNSPGAHVLQIIREGTPASRTRERGEITLNGHVVVGPNDLATPEREMTRWVQLVTDNVLKVRIDGSPDAKWIVMIRENQDQEGRDQPTPSRRRADP